MLEFAPGERFNGMQRRRALQAALPHALVVVVMLSGAMGVDEIGVRVFYIGLAALVAFMLASILVNDQSRWKAFRIVVDPDAVQTIRWPAHHDVLIRGDEISKVEEVPDRGLTIRGATKHQVIAIPAELERYAELRELIAHWRQPTLARPSAVEKVGPWLASVVAAGLLWATWIAASRQVAVVSATLLFLLLFAVAWSESRNPYVFRTHRVVWWVFALLAAFLALARVRGVV